MVGLLEVVVIFLVVVVIAFVVVVVVAFVVVVVDLRLVVVVVTFFAVDDELVDAAFPLWSRFRIRRAAFAVTVITGWG